MEEIYRKNELETNEFVSRSIRLIGLFVLLFGILCWVRIFDIYNYIIDGFILVSLLPLALPTILVDLLHINKKWVKYVLLLCVAFVTGAAYVFFTFQTVLVYVIPSILAAFYLDKKVTAFTGIVSVAAIAVSHLVTGFHLYQPWIEPFIGLKSILLYGALPRILQYLCCLALLYVLSARCSQFMESFFTVLKANAGRDENAAAPDRSGPDAVNSLLTQREKDVFELLVKGFTNAQIASRLFLSNGTVKNYVSSLYDKIGTRDRTALILKYGSRSRKHD